MNLKTLKLLIFVTTAFFIALVLDLTFPKTEFRTEKLKSITYFSNGDIISEFETLNVNYEVDGKIGYQMIIVDHKSRILNKTLYTTIIPHNR